MKKEVWIVLAGILIIIVGSFFMFKTKSCSNEYCFEEAISNCDKAKITLEEEGSVTYYEIEGEEGNDCRIYIKLESLSSAGKNAALFEDADMICDVPKEEFSRMNTDEMMDNLDYCHGRLKEAIYEVTLKNLYGLVTRDMGNVLNEISEVL